MSNKIDIRALLHEFNGKKILVTGGTGFIGGRLIEILCRYTDAEVHVFLRNLARASRISRFPVTMIKGDILNYDDVQNSTRKMDYIFHCAYGNKGTPESRENINAQGTENMLRASRGPDLKRFVHLSTMVVYGLRKDGYISENQERVQSNNVYSDSKLLAEKLAEEYYQNHNVPITILQPSAVYGPYAPTWTVRIIDMLKRNKVILIDNGNGVCNQVYIDDLILAMLLSATEDAAIGQRYLISSHETISWKDFYTSFCDLMEVENRFVYMDNNEALDYYNKSTRDKRLSEEVRAILQEYPEIKTRIARTKPGKYYSLLKQKIKGKPAGKKTASKKTITGAGSAHNSSDVNADPPLPPDQIDFYSSQAVVDSTKAKEELGYVSQYSFRSGMERTAKWIEWSNILNT